VTMTAPTTMSAVPSHAPRGARSVEEQHRQDQRDRSTEPVDGRDPQRITELERAEVAEPRSGPRHPRERDEQERPAVEASHRPESAEYRRQHRIT
jgi:hypothetical protein